LHSTNNLEDGYIGSGDRLKSSVRHYGKKNHKLEILEFHDSRDLVMQREGNRKCRTTKKSFMYEYNAGGSQVIEIKTMLSGNIKVSEIAKIFQISITTIRKINRGDIWTHVNLNWLN
jgi:hypothetical protein